MSTDSFNHWQAASDMALLLEKHMRGSDPNPSIHRPYRLIAASLAWGGIPDIEAAAGMDDAELVAIRDMTPNDVWVIRTAWFSMSGNGSQRMIRAEIAGIGEKLRLYQQQAAQLDKRMDVLKERLLVLKKQQNKKGRRRR